jgi:hypothetical protein
MDAWKGQTPKKILDTLKTLKTSMLAEEMWACG